MNKEESETDLSTNLTVIFYMEIIVLLLWCKPFCRIKRILGVSIQLIHQAQTDCEELDLLP